MVLRSRSPQRGSVRVHLKVLRVRSRGLCSLSEGSPQYVKLGTETTILVGQARSGRNEVIRHLANAVAPARDDVPSRIRTNPTQHRRLVRHRGRGLRRSELTTEAVINAVHRAVLKHVHQGVQVNARPVRRDTRHGVLRLKCFGETASAERTRRACASASQPSDGIRRRTRVMKAMPAFRFKQRTMTFDRLLTNCTLTSHRMIIYVFHMNGTRSFPAPRRNEPTHAERGFRTGKHRHIVVPARWRRQSMFIYAHTLGVFRPHTTTCENRR